MTEDQFTPAASEWFHPDPEMARNARVPDYESLYAHAMQDIEAFWAERAATLDWYEPWQQVLDRSDAPFFRWFSAAKPTSSSTPSTATSTPRAATSSPSSGKASPATARLTPTGSSGRRPTVTPTCCAASG